MDTRGVRQEGQQRDKLQRRLYLGSAVILLAGLAMAAIVYQAAGSLPPGAPDFDIEDSRKSLHDLELYGGKTNVLVAECMVWFSGLWHGQSLAGTIACIAVLLSCALFFIARYWPSDADD